MRYSGIDVDDPAQDPPAFRHPRSDRRGGSSAGSGRDSGRGRQGRVPGIGIATVYRNVKALLEEGWLHEVELPGEPSRYEVAGKDHHHHFRCRRCDRVFDIHGCPGNLAAMTPQGFEVEAHEIVLYGRCDDCTGDGRRAAASAGRPLAAAPAQRPDGAGPLRRRCGRAFRWSSALRPRWRRRGRRNRPRCRRRLRRCGGLARSPATAIPDWRPARGGAGRAPGRAGWPARSRSRSSRRGRRRS